MDKVLIFIRFLRISSGLAQWGNRGGEILRRRRSISPEATGLQVVDISDPANLSVAASYSTTQPAVGVTIAPDAGHVVVTTGVSGSGTVLTLDISDPTNPTLSDQASLPGLGADVVVAADGFGHKTAKNLFYCKLWDIAFLVLGDAWLFWPGFCPHVSPDNCLY